MDYGLQPPIQTNMQTPQKKQELDLFAKKEEN